MLSPWQKLTLGGYRMEMSYLSKVEVKWQVLMLILDGEVVVSAVVLWAVTESNVLSADLDIGVASPSHHLNLKVIELLLVSTWCSYWELN